MLLYASSVMTTTFFYQPYLVFILYVYQMSTKASHKMEVSNMTTTIITATGTAPGIAAKYTSDSQSIRNLAFKDFVNRASMDDWARLMDEARSTSKTGETLRDKYGFSWTTARPYAIRLGLYQPTRDNSQTSAATSISELPTTPFKVESDAVKGKFVTRSIQLNEATKSRLEKLEEDYPMYNHKSILNQIINDGLAMHGF